jgi:hypothetical protein
MHILPLVETLSTSIFAANFSKEKMEKVYGSEIDRQRPH